MTDSHLYKILTPADRQAAQTTGVTATKLDETDGYVHLSTRAQVGETLRLHYSGQDGTHLLEFDGDAIGAVKWEPSRGGELFPHLYGPLKVALARREWVLTLNTDGAPALPEDL